MDLDESLKHLRETYTEEQIVYSIKENTTPEKPSLLYVMPFEATEILESRIDKIIKSIDKLLDDVQFIDADSARVQELKKRYTNIQDQYLCEQYQIMLLIMRGIAVKNNHVHTTDNGQYYISCVEELDIEKTVYDGFYASRDEYLEILNAMTNIKQEINNLMTDKCNTNTNKLF